MPLDLTLTPLYRTEGKEQASLPGLLPAMPPRKTARGREHDRLVVYLLLTGNASYSTGEYVQFTSRAAVKFYETSGTLTFALRAAAESINQLLLERNLSTSGRGQYAVGLLSLVALRESEATLLSSGPMHAYVLKADGVHQIFDSLSGNGLGLGANAPHHFSRIPLQPNDRLVLYAKIPYTWESALKDSSPASLEATRRRLMNLTNDNVNAVLLQATEGNGALIVMRPESESGAPEEPALSPPTADASTSLSTGEERIAEPQAEPMPNAHLVQPSAYAIPPEPKEEELPPQSFEPDILASLPRLQPLESPPISKNEEEAMVAEPIKESKESSASPSPRTRQAAKTIVSGMRAWRRGNEQISKGLQSFLPRLLPGSEESSTFTMPSYMMAVIAIIIPLVVVTVASVVYFRYGRSVQYEEYLVQARNARAIAIGLTDPVAQREAWQQELSYLNNAESNSQTTETQTMRQEAQAQLDQLEGITRLQFQPVVSGLNAQISRMAADENNLYMLDAVRGDVLHVTINSSGFQTDDSFHCEPGTYGNYTVGPLVDILSLPTVNSMNASVMGVDANGNLLYCAPGQLPQAIPLPPPDTNWGRVKAFALDGDNLYVIDPPSRAVWVYVGNSDAFVDRPYFFFGDQVPNIENAIDLAVNNGELYILHADGHLSTCSYSALQTVPTRCNDPAALTDPFPAYRDTDLFSQTHFIQMMFAPAPDSTLLILDTDNQSILRFAPLSLQLQSQLQPPAGRANPFPPIPASAMTVSPNHILFMALKDEVYFATESP